VVNRRVDRRPAVPTIELVSAHPMIWGWTKRGVGVEVRNSVAAVDGGGLVKGRGAVSCRWLASEAPRVRVARSGRQCGIAGRSETMTLARDIMTADPQCVGESQTLRDAAALMRDLDVGALPICGDDGRLKGMLTDRDIVVKSIADGGDPATVLVSTLAEGKPVTIGADDDVQEVLDLMQQHQVRRLPVIDGHDLVGVISQADIARALSEEDTGETVAEISE
jgi:CBS domain-containing protein